MGHEDFYELTAAYALDALDKQDELSYVEHLRSCPQCREDLGAIQDTAGLLAYGAAAEAPPPALRERILDQARSERTNVIPIRRRWALPAAASVAAVAAMAAIGLGIWASSLRSDLSGEREARTGLEQVLSVISDPGSERVSPSVGSGTLVVSPTGAAALILSNLAPAPSGKIYEAWIAEDPAPKPAGLFQATGDRTHVALTRPVPKGATVMVTLEPAGGTTEPSAEPLFAAKAA
ncbi:MAG TPA: anti-sigma factor [Gaiellaceae bacterium]|nr:anti-sigma factor [Gaiellaceae bacterium]